MSSKIYDCLIIGGGPAGLTAGLTMGRCGRPAVVFDSKEYRDGGSKYMHMVLANDHANPAQWRDTARQQMLDNYPMIEFEYTKIVTITKISLETSKTGFEVKDGKGQSWKGKKLILATGTRDLLPDNIEGYKENWGRHMYVSCSPRCVHSSSKTSRFHCYVCQGMEYKDQTVGIVGWPSGMFSLYTQTALAYSKDIIIFGNGDVADDTFSQTALKTALGRGVRLEERRIKRVIDHGSGDKDGMSVELEDGERIKVGILYSHPHVASRGKDLFQQLGIETSPVESPMGMGDDMVVQMFNKANVEGVFGAGDTAGPFKSYTLAMSSGNMAGMGVVWELVMEEAMPAGTS